ncbi:MAG: hypothetical protein M3Z83_01045, partial [Actinomycetota bacterium]|nr:hypothetical protein [Actinomycetota bacterium]
TSTGTSTTPTSTSTTPTSTTTTPSTGVTAEQIATCVPALQAWSSALTKAQTALQSYSTALTTAQQQLAKQAAAAKSSGSASGSGSGSSQGSSAAGTGSTPSGSGSSASGSGSSASSSAARSSGTSSGSGASSGSSSGATATSPQALLAKQLTDQAAISTAEYSVSAAQANLAAATLTSPIAGIVGQIGLTPGQGESGSQGITIVGAGAANVSVDVPLTTIASIKQGDAATVSPPGLNALTGSVSQISLLPTSATTATPTYAVTVLLPDAPQVLATGSKVTTSIVTSTAANVLTVPASATQGSTSGSASVDVLKDGQLSSVPVTLGAVGGGLAEVRTGLNEGDQVVIADVTAPLPTNQSQFVRGLTGGGGGGPGPGGRRPGG